MAGPCSAMMSHAFCSASRLPTSAPSSRNQQFCFNSATSSCIFLAMGRWVTAQSMGPIGSPWCTPAVLRMDPAPKLRTEASP